MTRTQLDAAGEFASALRASWEVSETDFPGSGSAAEKLAFLLRYAVLAPSTRNTQPWLFRLKQDVVEILADRTRFLPALDAESRELVMSCGAAAFHLRVAMRHFGYAGELTEMPDPAVPDILVRIGLGEAARPSREDDLLFRAISKRRTFRHAFVGQPVPDELVHRATGDPGESGVWIHRVEQQSERLAIADLVSQGEYHQLNNVQSRQEMLAWMHPNYQGETDGIPGYALGSPLRASWTRPVTVSTYEIGAGQAARDRLLPLNAPVLLVIGTESDELLSWFRTGQVLAKLLLRCAAEDVYASFLNQPIQLETLRPRVLEAIGKTGYPQIILRLGYGAPTTPTPRRPITEVTAA